MYLVSKASSDYWYDFIDESNVINLYNKLHSFVFKKNTWFEDDPDSFLEFWEGLTKEDAIKITQCEYEILIYDDYIE